MVEVWAVAPGAVVQVAVASVAEAMAVAETGAARAAAGLAEEVRAAVAKVAGSVEAEETAVVAGSAAGVVVSRSRGHATQVREDADGVIHLGNHVVVGQVGVWCVVVRRAVEATNDGLNAVLRNCRDRVVVEGGLCCAAIDDVRTALIVHVGLRNKVGRGGVRAAVPHVHAASQGVGHGVVVQRARGNHAAKDGKIAALHRTRVLTVHYRGAIVEGVAWFQAASVRTEQAVLAQQQLLLLLEAAAAAAPHARAIVPSRHRVEAVGAARVNAKVRQGGCSGDCLALNNDGGGYCLFPAGLSGRRIDIELPRHLRAVVRAHGVHAAVDTVDAQPFACCARIEVDRIRVHAALVDAIASTFPVC
eukprot:4028703-Prymnesium_polylepis.2